MPSLTGAAILENAAPAASKGSDHPSPSDVFWLIHLKGAHIYSIQSFWHIQIMVVKLGVAMVMIMLLPSWPCSDPPILITGVFEVAYDMTCLINWRATFMKPKSVAWVHGAFWTGT